jgi:hypothetical protein
MLTHEDLKQQLADLITSARRLENRFKGDGVPPLVLAKTAVALEKLRASLIKLENDIPVQDA